MFQICYVHNLGFDIRHIINYCMNNDIKYIPILSGSNMIACIIPEYKVKFIDSVQFLQCSQEKAEIEWNVNPTLRKLDCSDLFNKPFKNWNQNDKDRVFAHNKNDVLALFDIMLKFRKTMFDIASVDICSIISIASTALKALRITLKEQILNPYIETRPNSNGKRTYIRTQKNIDLEKFVRSSYFGGRTEVFDLNRHKDVIYLDRVSMFPAEMASKRFPIGLPKFISNIDVLNEIINENTMQNASIYLPNGKLNKFPIRLGCIKCIVKPTNLKPEAQLYPVLPKRMDNRVMFTNVDMKGIWTTIELNYARNMGYEIIPIKGVIFPETSNVFEPFVNKFFPIKQNNKGGKKKGAKILLNGCYGKTGESIVRKDSEYQFFKTKDDMLDFYPQDTNWNNLYHNYSPELKLWIVIERKESIRLKQHMLVHLASFTTSYSRIHLIKQIHNCFNHHIKVLYCDSDSIPILKSDLSKFKQFQPLSHELGSWDIEASFKEVQFVAPKAYFAVIDKAPDMKSNDRLIKLKGCPERKLREIEKNVSEPLIINNTILYNSMDEIEQQIKAPIELAERYQTFKQALRNGVMLATRELTKHFSHENLKRNFKNKESIPWTNETLPEKFKKDKESITICN